MTTLPTGRNLLGAQVRRGPDADQGGHRPLGVPPGGGANQEPPESLENRLPFAGCLGRIPHDLRRTAVRNLARAGIPRKSWRRRPVLNRGWRFCSADRTDRAIREKSAKFLRSRHFRPRALLGSCWQHLLVLAPHGDNLGDTPPTRAASVGGRSGHAPATTAPRTCLIPRESCNL